MRHHVPRRQVYHVNEEEAIRLVLAKFWTHEYGNWIKQNQFRRIYRDFMSQASFPEAEVMHPLFLLENATLVLCRRRSFPLLITFAF